MPDYSAIAAIAASRAHKRNALAEQRARYVAKHSTNPSTRATDARDERVSDAAMQAARFFADTYRDYPPVSDHPLNRKPKA